MFFFLFVKMEKTKKKRNVTNCISFFVFLRSVGYIIVVEGLLEDAAL